jgi:hypothetical protein
MAGQIIKRGECTWLVRVSLGRDPEGGKRRYHSHTVHGTPEDAKRYRDGFLRDRDLGATPSPSALRAGSGRYQESQAGPSNRFVHRYTSVGS